MRKWMMCAGGILFLLLGKSQGQCWLTVQAAVVSCQGDTAEVCAAVSGGPPPYSYIWNTGEASSCITVIAPASYSVSVWDGAQCSATDTGYFSGCQQPCQLAANTSISCQGNQGVVCAYGSGGTPPYTYHWFNGDTTACITLTQAGGYQVTVTDSTGCSTVTGGYFSGCGSSCQLGVWDSVACPGTTGIICVYAMGGTPPYTYYWMNGDTNPCIMMTQPGGYAVTVVDALGCSVIDTGYFYGCTVTCQLQLYTGSSCDSACAWASGGSGHFSYTWNTGDTSNCVGSISPGLYHVTVYDLVTGCYDTASVVVSSTPISISIVSIGCTNPGDSTGYACISVTGGSGGPYSIWWSTGDTGYCAFNLPSDSVKVWVYDSPCLDWTIVYIPVCSGVAPVSDNTKPFEYWKDDGSIIITPVNPVSIVVYDNTGEVIYMRGTTTKSIEIKRELIRDRMIFIVVSDGRKYFVIREVN